MKRLIVASTVACLLSVLPGLAHRNARAENLEVQGTLAVKNNANTYIWNARFTNNADPPAVYQYKSRGTSIDAHGLVLDWDCLGKNSFVGSGRTNGGTAAWLYGCVYRAMVDGTPNNGYMPTRFHIDTCPNTGTIVYPATAYAPVARFTIMPDGKVGIGTTNPGFYWHETSPNPPSHWDPLSGVPSDLALHVVGSIITQATVVSTSFVNVSSRDYKREVTPVPATGSYSFALDRAPKQRSGAWDLLDRLNVVDYEYKKREQHWLMPDGRVVKSYDEASSTVCRVMDGKTITEVLQPDQVGAKEFTAWVEEGSGEVHRGFIAEELPDEFTTDHKSVIISDVVANNTGALKEAKRRILELEKNGGGFDTRLGAAEGARADLAKEVQQLATGVIRVEDLKPGAENTAVVMQLTESVLRQLGVDPWVEIALADAIETVPETNPVTSVKGVTKYRLNIASRQIEPYAVEESATEQVPTGQTVERLKSGVRFDETTGKLYRWVGLSSADAAQKLAALHTKFGAPPSDGVSAIASHQTALRASISNREEENGVLFPSSSLCVLKPADAH